MSAACSSQNPQHNEDFARPTARRLLKGDGSHLIVLDSAVNGSNMSRHLIPPNGLTAIFNPEKPSLDIVFVHGFTGHPVRTWTHNKGDAIQHDFGESEVSEPLRKKPKLNLFSKSQVCVFTTILVFLNFAFFVHGHC